MAQSNEAHPAPLRVLCVDDEPVIREVLGLLLRKYGYTVESVTDGLTALRLLQEKGDAFDVVVTDNQMPELSGIEMVERLRAGGYNGRIVFYSSTLGAKSAARLAPLKIDAVIAKGGPITELITALSAIQPRAGAQSEESKHLRDERGV
jgi:two-component system response regulator EvgA